MTLCVVTCGKKKIWDRHPVAGPTPAGGAYIGSLARKCIEYAEQFYPNHWCILSANYGFLLPDTLIENYNITWGDEG